MIAKTFKDLLNKFPKFKLYILSLREKFYPIRGRNNKIIRKGLLYHCKFSIIGNNNTILVDKNCIIKNTVFHIHGNKNTIQIGRNGKVYMDANLWIDGDHNKIIIGDDVTIQSAHLCVQEVNNGITIGDECMISNNIEIRTSDSHPIYEIKSGKRINPAKSIFIGNRVWIAAKAIIMKGVKIGDGSIIGYGSLVTRDIPQNVIAVGRPAEISKKEVYWEHTFC